MAKHDFVIVGAGVNGLTVAGYLAKAGFNVGVVERRDFVSGGAQTQELIPGYKIETDSCVHGYIAMNPMIFMDELDLKAKYGLNYLRITAEPNPDSVIMFRDGTHYDMYMWSVDKTVESIAKISPADAEAYLQFIKDFRPVTDFFARGLSTAAPSIGPMFNMLDSNPVGRKCLDLLLRSATDIINMYFHDERVKVALMKQAAETVVNPDSAFTGINLAMNVTHQHEGFNLTPAGGGQELGNALRRQIEDHGGTIYLNFDVKEILFENGKACGVKSVDGDVVLAKNAVISSLVPQLTINKMCPEEVVPAELRTSIDRILPSEWAPFASWYACEGMLKFDSLNESENNANIYQLLPSTVDELRTMFDDIRRGIPPKVVAPYLFIHDHTDPSKAPAGCMTFQMMGPAPYNLADGGPQKWDEIKDAYEEHRLDHMRALGANIDEIKIASLVRSPLDIERWNPNYYKGDPMGIGPQLQQYMGWRPTPELARQKTPIDGLWICGTSVHPGGGVTGGSRGCAQLILDEYGIDFDKLVAK